MGAGLLSGEDEAVSRYRATFLLRASAKEIDNKIATGSVTQDAPCRIRHSNLSLWISPHYFGCSPAALRMCLILERHGQLATDH